jgi:CRP-like cAMP-binding protein
VYPDSKFKSGWDIVTAVFIGVQATLIPLSIAFSDLAQEWSYLDIALQAFFGLDILLNFNLAYYELGALVTTRKAIAKHYISGWFLIDILATFPIELIICGDMVCQGSNLSKSIKLLRFSKMFRLVRLAKLNSIMFTIEDISSSNLLATVFLVLKLVMILFMMAHWLACFWLFVAFFVSDDYPQTWLSSMVLADASRVELYVSAMYWALTTAISVGYGDIKPMNIAETNVCLGSMVVSSVIFAYLVGSVTALVAQQTEHETAHREQFMILVSYLKRKEVPKSLTHRVKRYFNYLWERKQQQPIHETTLLSSLSKPLRASIYSLTRGPIFANCRVFVERFENQIQVLSELLVPEVFAPSDNVFNEGELSSSLYFIKSGEVDVYQRKTRSSYKVLGEHEHFGEIGFFSRRPRCASVKCLFFCELFKLERVLVDVAFESIPEALSNLKLVEERLMEEDLSILDLVCYICQQKNHVASRCPSVIIISDQNELKRHWLEQRKNQTKYIDIDEQTPVRRQVKNYDYNIRNVNGSPTRVPFKDSALLRKAQKYIKDNAIRESMARKAMPQLSMLFGQDSDDEQFEEPVLSFGRSIQHRESIMFLK